MSRRRAFFRDALFVAGFLILPFLLYGGVTVGSDTMIPADNLYQWEPWASEGKALDLPPPQNGLLSDLVLENYVWRRFIEDSLAARVIPLWNPNIFAGTPFLATGQHAAYYPFAILFLIMPLAKAYGWYTISQLWLAGVSAYILGRVLGLRRTSAAFAGLAFQGSGFLLVSSAVFPMILGAAIWLPFLLACLEMILRHATSEKGAGRVFPWSAVGAVGLGMQILSGHIEITYYTLLVMAVFSLWRLITYTRRQWGDSDSSRIWPVQLLRPTGWLLATVLLGLALGAIQFIPFVEIGQANFREGAASLEQVRGWAFPPRRLITLFAPDFFGNPADHQYLDVFTGRQMPFETNLAGDLNPHGPYSSNWGIKNYVEGGIYVGVATLLVAGLAIWSAWRVQKKRRSAIGFFSVLSLFSLLFIFGTPAYAILYYGLPGINQLHSPFRWVFPLSLGLAMLAGFGFDYLISYRRSAEDGARSWWASLLLFGDRRSPPGFLAAISLWSGLLLLAGLLLSRYFFNRLEDGLTTIFLGLERAPDAFPDVRVFYSYEFEQLAVLALMLLLTGAVLRMVNTRLEFRGRPAWIMAALVVLGLDLFIAGRGFHASVDPGLLERRPPVIKWLADQPGLWRLTTFSPHGDKTLNANSAWLAGFQDVRGYDSIILKQYSDYMEAIEPQNELQFNRIQPIVNWESLNSPLLDLLGVKYIISQEQIDLPKLRVAWQEGALFVYENLSVAPRAYTISREATFLSADPLEAMRERDPRQFVHINRQDWEGAGLNIPKPGVITPAEIVDYGNIEVTIRADVARSSWLVLNDTYFQGWDVFLTALDGDTGRDEFQSEIVRVNGNFRGVALEPGQWEARFRYSPLTFKLGGLISFMSGVILVFGLAVWAWRNLYDPQTPLTNTRSIAKNSLAPMTLNLFNRAIDFAFAAFYLRILGPADAGKYATAIIIAGWFEIISNWGLNTLVIREVASDRSQASRYLLNTTVLRLGTGIMAALPVFIYLGGIRLGGNPLDGNTALAVFLLMAGMVFSGMAQGLAGLYYAFETAEFPAAVTTITTILKVAFGVLALLLGYGFVGLAAVSILVNLATLLILSVAAFRHFNLPGPWRMDFALQRQMISTSYPLMLNHLFAVIFFQIDVPLMRQFNGDKVVGWYNSAYKWINAFNVIPSFFTFALFPVITRQVSNSLDDARRTFRLALKLMLLVAFPLATVTMLLAPVMIAILGGSEFLPHGAVALQLVVWSIPIGWINSVTNYVLIALGREKRLTRAFVIGVSFNLIANLLLLPRYSYLAASVITIASELVLLYLFARYLRPAMPGVGWSKLLIRPLALAALMTWAVVLGARVHLLVGLAAAVVTFPLGLWSLRVFGDEERRVLHSLLPERLAGWIPFTVASDR